MPLTDAQIDRYSRQIIVPHVGGRGQERLLAARMVIAGDPRDTEAPLAYMVGAGVGAIFLKPSADQRVFVEKRELNPDVTVTDELKAPIDLALLIIGSEAARKVADEIVTDHDVRALVIARLDAPGTITIIPNTKARNPPTHRSARAPKPRILSRCSRRRRHSSCLPATRKIRRARQSSSTAMRPEFAPICDRNSDVGAVVERHDSFAADILGPSPTQNA